MEEVIQAFAEDVPAIERIINGFLASNPALAGMQVDIIRLKAKPEQLNLALFEAVNHNPNDCKVCVDENGVEYCYWGPNGCPSFD